MNNGKLSLLVTLSVLFLFSINVWKDGELQLFMLIGGLAVTILSYFIVSEVIKGINLHRNKNDEQNIEMINQMSQWKTSFESRLNELGQTVSMNFSQQAELIKQNHETQVNFREKLLEVLDTQLHTKQEQIMALHKSVEEGLSHLQKVLNQQINGMKEVSANLVEQTVQAENRAQIQAEHTKEIANQINQWNTSFDGHVNELGQSFRHHFSQGIEVMEKTHHTQVDFQEKLMEKIDNQFQSKQEKITVLSQSIEESIGNLQNAANQQIEGIKAISANLLEQTEKEDITAQSQIELAEKQLEIIQQSIDKQIEFNQKHLETQQEYLQGMIEQVKFLEQNANTRLHDQFEKQLSKTEEIMISLEAISKEQQMNFANEVSTIITEIKTHSVEQLQSIQVLAQRVKENGQALHESVVHSLAGYQDGLKSVLHSMEESTIHLQEEVSNQSNRQVDKIEEVIESLKSNTLTFHEKMEELMTSAHSSTIESQKSIVSSSNQQTENLERMAASIIDSFEGMQAEVSERNKEQYSSISMIIEELSHSVEGSQNILGNYTKDQVNKLNEVVSTVKKEMTTSIQELKNQGENQLNKMQAFVELSKHEASDTRLSMDQHHQSLLKELKSSLEKIVQYQTEENKVIVQKTSDFIEKFSEFHKELLGENRKQLELSETQQSELRKQIEVFRDLLVPLTDLHNNLQVMAKEEYQKLYVTMELLSASLVETISSKDSLRTQIVRMQDGLLQKLK